MCTFDDKNETLNDEARWHSPAKYSTESRCDITQKTGSERHTVGALNGVQSTAMDDERVCYFSLSPTGHDAGDNGHIQYHA